MSSQIDTKLRRSLPMRTRQTICTIRGSVIGLVTSGSASTACSVIVDIFSSGDRIRTGDLPIMSRMLSPTELRRLDYRALCGNRTHHLFLTMEVLYRMS